MFRGLKTERMTDEVYPLLRLGVQCNDPCGRAGCYMCPSVAAMDSIRLDSTGIPTLPGVW